MRFKRTSIIALVVFFVLSLVNFSPVNAYQGGLLDGQPMAVTTKGQNIDWTNTVIEATDGDPNTNVVLKYSAGINYLHYRFANPVDIDSYQLHLASTSSAIRLRFFDENGTVLVDKSSLVKNGTKTDLITKGVSEVWISSDYSGARVIDFDVFGQNATAPQPQPEAPQMLAVTGQTTTSVDLVWNSVASPDLLGYNVYVDGTQTSGIVTNNSYTITGLTPGLTYTVYVTALYANGTESSPSNTVTITLEEPIAGNAVLKIYLNSGIEREYDLSTIKISEFINWYDNRANGFGNNYYPFVKSVNLGSFKKITQYITFDKIVTFDVNEY